jgi:hypothetical protein
MPVGYGLPKNSKALELIGRIAVRHGQLDNALKMTIMDLTGVTKDEALDANARRGSRELRDRVRKLAKQRLGEGVALVQLDALLERAQRASDKRNEILHSPWGTDDGKLVVRSPDHSFRRPTLKELRDAHEEIGHIIADLFDAQKQGFLSKVLKKDSTPVSSSG